MTLFVAAASVGAMQSLFSPKQLLQSDSTLSQLERGCFCYFVLASPHALICLLHVNCGWLLDTLRKYIDRGRHIGVDPWKHAIESAVQQCFFPRKLDVTHAETDPLKPYVPLPFVFVCDSSGSGMTCSCSWCSRSGTC
jgi:hypothetical protein